MEPYHTTVNVIHQPLTRTASSASLGVPGRVMADPEGVGRKVAPEIGSHRLVVTPVWTECFGEHEHEANIWGCKRLGMPLTRWGGGWLEYGWFDKNGVWHFDKARIRHELEVRIHENRLCPVLDSRRIMQTLDKLPDSIDPKRDPNWEYITTYEKIRGEYKEIATGIRPVIRRAAGYVIGDFRPSWEVDDEANATPTGRKIMIDPAEMAEVRRQVAATREQPKRSGCLSVILVMIALIGVVLISALLSS